MLRSVALDGRQQDFAGFLKCLSFHAVFMSGNAGADFLLQVPFEAIQERFFRFILSQPGYLFEQVFLIEKNLVEACPTAFDLFDRLGRPALAVSSVRSLFVISPSF